MSVSAFMFNAVADNVISHFLHDFVDGSADISVVVVIVQIILQSEHLCVYVVDAFFRHGKIPGHLVELVAENNILVIGFIVPLQKILIVFDFILKLFNLRIYGKSVELTHVFEVVYVCFHVFLPHASEIR